MAARVKVDLPCGCAVACDHDQGQRLVRCGGHARPYVIQATKPRGVTYVVFDDNPKDSE